MRDLLIELASRQLFRAKWSDAIHDEWIRSVLARRPDLTPARLNRTRTLMNAAVMDCLVEGYDRPVSSLALPDPDDRHVLAAAIHCGADAIVTFNLRDFPAEEVGQYDIESSIPTNSCTQFGLSQSAVILSAHACRQWLRNPPKTAQAYLEILAAQGLPKTVAELRPFVGVI